jgi:hypothetical protein
MNNNHLMPIHVAQTYISDLKLCTILLRNHRSAFWQHDEGRVSKGRVPVCLMKSFMPADQFCFKGDQVLAFIRKS